MGRFFIAGFQMVDSVEVLRLNCKNIFSIIVLTVEGYIGIIINKSLNAMTENEVGNVFSREPVVGENR